MIIWLHLLTSGHVCHSRNEKPPKKGKPAKRGGVTAAAATEFSNPPAQVFAISSTASIFNANSLLPLSIDDVSVPAHKDASTAIRAQPLKLEDPSSTVIPAEKVTQSYGGYIPDDDEEHDENPLPGSAGASAYQVESIICEYLILLAQY